MKIYNLTERKRNNEKNVIDHKKDKNSENLCNVIAVDQIEHQ